ncbi:hypothetical protein YC2023_117481 [Brassica napus]
MQLGVCPHMAGSIVGCRINYGKPTLKERREQSPTEVSKTRRSHKFNTSSYHKFNTSSYHKLLYKPKQWGKQDTSKKLQIPLHNQQAQRSNPKNSAAPYSTGKKPATGGRNTNTNRATMEKTPFLNFIQKQPDRNLNLLRGGKRP